MLEACASQTTMDQAHNKDKHLESNSHELQDGQRWNQYVELKDLGSGSYGCVKLVLNDKDNRNYAMKITSKKKLIRQAGFSRRPPRMKKKVLTPLQRIYEEIAILKKLDHPNVIKLVEVLDDDNRDHICMVFELMEKGEIMEVPTDDPLDETTARKYFRDTLLGLEYLHHQKILHRDIKPENLLLDEHGNVKIADLGVSQQFTDDDAEISSSVGTPAFLPPEAVSKEYRLDGKFQGRPLDVWSLGVTLYCLVFGTTPFISPNIMALNEKICNDELVFPSPKSSELTSLLREMLTKDPAKRIKIPDIKQHRWVTCDGTQPLPSEAHNCRQIVTVTDEEINSSVTVIPNLYTVIMMKQMGKNRSFKHPSILK